MPHLGTEDPGSLPRGVQEIGPPQDRCQKPGGGCCQAPGGKALEKKSCSDSHETWWGGGQGCGEVCPEDGKWIPTFPWKRRGPEQMCQMTSKCIHPRGSPRNAWVDFDGTRREPCPHRGPPPLKTASPYPKPPRSSATRSKMCQMTSGSTPAGEERVLPWTRRRPRQACSQACLSQLFSEQNPNHHHRPGARPAVDGAPFPGGAGSQACLSQLFSEPNPNHHHISMEDVPAPWRMCRLHGGCAVSAGKAAKAPGGHLPSKNQSRGGGPPSREGDGDMCPTSERKTPGACREGCGRWGLPRIDARDLGEVAARPPGEKPSKKKVAPILTKLGGEVGRGVGRCAPKTESGCLPSPGTRAARSKCAK